MGRTYFKEIYRQNWIGAAHGFGVLGNLVFLALWYWEYGILIVLGWNTAKSLGFPFTIELTLWFFAGVGCKQIICWLQQNQQKRLEEGTSSDNECMAAWRVVRTKQEYTDADEENERLRIIEKKKLMLLYGDKIPNSGIHIGVTIFVVVVFLCASIWIITNNRNASNKKNEDREVAAAYQQIDSTSNVEIATFRRNINAEVGSISARGSADTKKINDLKQQIASLQADISETAYLAVNRKSELYGEKKKAEKKLSDLMEGDNYDVQKADKETEITTFEKSQDSTCKVEKLRVEASIRRQHGNKNTGINALAIITNVLYLLFNFWKHYVRTITGNWTFDIFELMFDGVAHLIGEAVAARSLAKAFAKDTPSVSTVENKVQQQPAIVEETKTAEVEQEKPQKRTIEIEDLQAALAKKENKIFNLVNKLPKSKSVDEVQQKTRTIRNKMTVSDFEAFMKAEAFDFEGCTAANIYGGVLKNGRDAIKNGRPDSPPVVRMNRLLDALRGYGILIDPDNKTSRGGFVRVVSQKEAA